MVARNNQPLFRLGEIGGTPGALQALQEATQSAVDLLRRHVHGDWGDVCREDWDTNDEALIDDLRVLSVYHLADKASTEIWIITESDRSVTTVLLPEEYR
jgi:hypothetical protein